MRYPKLVLALASIVFIAQLAPVSAQLGQYGDPPTRVGRVSDLGGAVSLYLNGAIDWTDAAINYPIISGDAIWADVASRAEIHLGASAIRLGARTAMSFGEISDSLTEIRIDEGSFEIYIHSYLLGEVYEVDTPNGLVTLAQQGAYRIDVTADGRRTTVTTRSGLAIVEIGTFRRNISAGNTATLLNSQRMPIVGAAIQTDSWEEWANGRDQRDLTSQSIRYLSPDMIGYEDLDDYGVWQRDPVYGAIWIPRDVPAGWAPYRYGRWESIQPWGWTWVDDAPWGFAPFHYGRWTYFGGRWAWVPGPVVSRSIYAPALVAFIGGNGWNASAMFGGRPAVGWVPLAPGEPYVPGYRTTSGYVDRINGGNGRNPVQPNTIDIRYVNRNVPGAVTAVSRDDFTRSRPIGRTAVAVRPGDFVGGRASNIPLAGDERLIPPPRDEVPVNNERGRNGGRTFVPPDRIQPRPRGGDTAVNDPRGRPNPVNPPAPPPTNPPAQQPPRGGRQGDTTRNDPRGRPGTPPPVMPPPPPPVNPPAQQPPRGGRQGDTTRNDPRGRPVTPPPVTPPPPPSTLPPDPVRSRPVPQQPDRSAEYQQKLSQLLAKQQREDADAVKRHAALQQHSPPGMSAAQVQQMIDAENKSAALRHQSERDALAKQYGNPAQ